LAQLKRTFNFYHLFAITIGATITSQYFLGNSLIFHQLGPFAFVSFVFGAIITYFVMAALRELTANHEHSGQNFIHFISSFLSKETSCAMSYSYWLGYAIPIAIEMISGSYLIVAFFPDVPLLFFIMLMVFGFALVIFNKNKWLGETSEFLTFTHLTIFAIFSIIGIVIFLGFAGNQQTFIGGRYLFPKEGILPFGILPFLSSTLAVMNNFQGVEAVSLAAAEAKNEKNELIKTMKELPAATSILYVLPMLVLGLITPWDQAPIQGSIFSIILKDYGFDWIGSVFSVLIVAGCLSSILSGFYVCSRALYTMSKQGFISKKLQGVSENFVPGKAIKWTFIFALLTVMCFFIFPSDKFFDNLFYFSAMTIALVWVGICLSHLKFRQNLTKKEISELKSKSKFGLIGSIIGVLANIAFILLMFINTSIRPAFYASLAVYVIPFLIFKIMKKRNLAK
jgi:arginine/ornithine permease